MERFAAAASFRPLATDHAPFDFATQKNMGSNDFTKIPNGIPSLEDRINLYFTHGVKGGRIDLHQFVDTASTQAAKIFGLFPRKGTIQPGSDADLVVYDPNYRGKISAKTHQMNLDYNSFEGFEIEGRPYSSPFVAKLRRGKGNSSAKLATESFSRASRIISRLRRGAKNEQLLPNPGERRQGVSPKLTA